MLLCCTHWDNCLVLTACSLAWLVLTACLLAWNSGSDSVWVVDRVLHRLGFAAVPGFCAAMQGFRPCRVVQQVSGFGQPSVSGLGSRLLRAFCWAELHTINPESAVDYSRQSGASRCGFQTSDSRPFSARACVCIGAAGVTSLCITSCRIGYSTFVGVGSSVLHL